jgi:hypothetical protein
MTQKAITAVSLSKVGTVINSLKYWNCDFYFGHAVAQFVEALRYKPQGRGFDSRWYYWKFSLT